MSSEKCVDYADFSRKGPKCLPPKRLRAEDFLRKTLDGGVAMRRNASTMNNGIRNLDIPNIPMGSGLRPTFMVLSMTKSLRPERSRGAFFYDHNPAQRPTGAAGLSCFRPRPGSRFGRGTVGSPMKKPQRYWWMAQAVLEAGPCSPTQPRRKPDSTLRVVKP